MTRNRFNYRNNIVTEEVNDEIQIVIRRFA
jgi:hypothetical protein